VSGSPQDSKAARSRQSFLEYLKFLKLSESQVSLKTSRIPSKKATTFRYFHKKGDYL